MNFSDELLDGSYILGSWEKDWEDNKLCFESLTPSPCGHSPYLIYDEQRESVDTLIRFFCCGYLFNPSVLRTPPSPIFCDAKHPVRLRDTAGEECEIFQRFCFTGVLSSPMLRLLLLSVADEMRKGRSRCLTLFLLLSVFFDISIELAPPLFRATFPICLCHRGGAKRLFSLISYWVVKGGAVFFLFGYENPALSNFDRAGFYFLYGLLLLFQGCYAFFERFDFFFGIGFLFALHSYHGFGCILNEAFVAEFSHHCFEESLSIF